MVHDGSCLPIQSLVDSVARYFMQVIIASTRDCTSLYGACHDRGDFKAAGFNHHSACRRDKSVDQWRCAVRLSALDLSQHCIKETNVIEQRTFCPLTIMIATIFSNMFTKTLSTRMQTSSKHTPSIPNIEHLGAVHHGVQFGFHTKATGVLSDTVSRHGNCKTQKGQGILCFDDYR